MVIASDGNFNREDIVYNQYKTSCIRKYFKPIIEPKRYFKKLRKPNIAYNNYYIIDINQIKIKD